MKRFLVQLVLILSLSLIGIHMLGLSAAPTTLAQSSDTVDLDAGEPSSDVEDLDAGGDGTKPPAQLPTSINVGSFLQTDDQSNQPQNIGAFLVRAVNILAQVVGSFAFLTMVVGGFILLASGGSETGIQKGKDVIKFAIIGLVIALSAYFITAFVQSVFFEFQGATAGGSAATGS